MILEAGAGELSFEMRAAHTVQAGDWSIEVATGQTATLPNGQFAYGPITLR